MLNLKSLKNALSCAYNNVFNSPLKKDLFHLANALEQLNHETGKAIMSQVVGKAFVGIDESGKTIYIYTESGSGYHFGIDRLKSFDDFTKDFNVYTRRAIEQALKQICWHNKYYETRDLKKDLNNWLKDC